MPRTRDKINKTRDKISTHLKCHVTIREQHTNMHSHAPQLVIRK